MIIHYQNPQGEGQLLLHIAFLQNIDGNWDAITDDNRTFHLSASGMKLILDDSIVNDKSNNNVRENNDDEYRSIRNFN